MTLSRSLSLGIPIVISWSNRPALLSELSIFSTLLVAPSTSISLLSTSSMLVKICAIIRFDISFVFSSRDEQIASSSSRKIMHGAFSFAFSKSCRIFFSEPPLTPETSSGVETEIILTPISPAELLQRRVFPAPGAPCTRIPLGGRTPRVE